MDPIDDDDSDFAGDYEAVTGSVRVAVAPIYLEDESDADNWRFVWAYRVQIANEGMETIQLINRHWIIMDGIGRVHEVQGAGVVGEQPVLEPGDVYEYTSGCPLETPSGVMQGYYEMRRQDGSMVQVQIPAFSLDSPHQQSTVN